MAIINNSKNFIFVHVPKAAGTSVTSALSDYTTYKDLEIGGTIFGEKVQQAYIERFGLAKHSPASNIKDVIGIVEWDKMFSFSIVRNPYTRVISTYKFLIKWSGTPEAIRKEVSEFNDINDYINSGIWDRTPGPDNIFRPQVFWLTDRDDRENLLVKYIGKCEDLDSHLSVIKSRIEGVDIAATLTPKLNSTEGDLELSKESISRINEFYERDFRLLGYDRMKV
ncbi:MAG: sulfotransferase family protein [Shewanella sp.]|nr:sulfotransferase family protein [Shewanella sp.]